MFEGFHGGLNTIDSPYTLADTESRDLMNVVSTERGSILKRNGSVLFTPEGVVFPTLVVKDSFERAEEKPLSNGGKWTTITGAANTGEILGAEKKWNATGFVTESGARWNVEEQANPAVSVERRLSALKAGTWFGVWACLSASAKSGYFLRYTETDVAGGATGGPSIGTVTIEKWAAGVKTVLATLLGSELQNKDLLGLTVRGEKVRAWRRHEGTWAELISAKDGTYTTGYTGVASQKVAEANVSLNNFAFGEIAAATNVPEVEFLSLFPAVISGTRYLIATGGKEIFSITTSGTITKIGEGFTEGKRWSMVQAPESKEVASEGPVYMTNGTDKAQYWTGAEAKTKVKEWTGLNAAFKGSDGVIKQLASKKYSSATGPFTNSDLQREITGEKLKAGTTIEKIISSTEIELSQEAEAEGSALKYEIKRLTYEGAPYVPQGKYMVFAGNRIWMTGIESEPSAVWFTELVPTGAEGSKADPSFWPRTNVVNFDKSDGRPITGIGTVGPYVVVFKENKTWVIHDLNTGANRKIADKIGCIAHRSIVETTAGTYFLTADQGVYLTNGSTLHEMSYNVKPTILKINATERENAAGEYWNNHYYLSFPSGTSLVNNRTLDYDAQLKSWWLHDLAGNQWCRFEQFAGEPYLFTIPPGKQKGVVRAFVPGVYEDSGAIYPGNEILSAWWLSPWQPFAYYVFRHRIKAPFLKKRVRAIFFDAEGELIPIVYKNFNVGGLQSPGVVHSNPETEPSFPVKLGAGGQIFGNENEEQKFGGEKLGGVEMLFGGATTTQDVRVYAPGVARVWGVGYGNRSGEPFKVDSFAYFIQFRKS